MTLPLLALLTTLSTAAVDDDRERALETYQRTHAEVSFGYLGQWSDERNRALELKSSGENPPLAGLVTDPFLGAPFDATVLAGPALEWRLVSSQVRFTVGVRFPFTNFRPSDTAQTVSLQGAPHEVLVRSVSLWDLRTGLGFELPFRRVTPFVDVLGDVQTLSTQLVIDGAPATYQGRAFSLGGRVGVRYQVNHLFVLLAAEATALGPLRLGGTLQAGVAF
ncbi:MAG: hypothetical protein ACOZQL_21270 [Myxococcota bacterium]